MSADSVIGWDFGGAHIKLAHLDGAGTLRQVTQAACPLWRGWSRFDAAMQQLVPTLPPGRVHHAITMTAELTDIFSDRRLGVAELLREIGRYLAEPLTRVWAGRAGLVPVAVAHQCPGQVASANWLATAEHLASGIANAVLVDIGSTTTDIVPIVDGRVRAQGVDDHSRLRQQELIYSGVVRTPLMALTTQVPFAGQWVSLMAEHFATTADVFRLTGDLPEHADLGDTADGGGKTPADSARRLARMVGHDLDAAPLQHWREVAAFIREQQVQQLLAGLLRVLSRAELPRDAPLVGAGVGRFLVATLATRAQRPYLEYGAWLERDPGVRSVADCAPAVAVANLLRNDPEYRSAGVTEPA